MNENIKQYIDIIPILNYLPLDDNTWEIVDEWEGLTEEFGIYDRDRWFVAELPITSDNEIELKKETENIMNFFNLFDIELKKKYNMKYIDLIDYKNGSVKIVTYK